VCVLLHVKLSSAVKMFIMRLSPFLSPFLSASSTNNSEGDAEVAGAAGRACICEDQRESTACTARAAQECGRHDQLLTGCEQRRGRSCGHLAVRRFHVAFLTDVVI